VDCDPWPRCNGDSDPRPRYNQDRAQKPERQSTDILPSPALPTLVLPDSEHPNQDRAQKPERQSTDILLEETWGMIDLLLYSGIAQSAFENELQRFRSKVHSAVQAYFAQVSMS